MTFCTEGFLAVRDQSAKLGLMDALIIGKFDQPLSPRSIL
jgi:hypothetical protein